MTLVTYDIPLVVSSDPDSGAVNITNNGSRFQIELEDPLEVPREAINCHMTVNNATAWNVFYNITEDNNVFRVTYNDGVLQVTLSIVIDPGLYDLDHLNEEIYRKLSVTTFPNNLFNLVPSTADQRVVIEFNYNDTSIDFTFPNNPREVLGFAAIVISSDGGSDVPQFVKGSELAKFNNIQYLLMHSDLVSRGIRVNNSYSQTIARLIIDVGPGEQIVYAPFITQKIPTPELAGELRNTITFWLTDDADNPVNTRGEFFSCELVVHYSMMMK